MKTLVYDRLLDFCIFYRKYLEYLQKIFEFEKKIEFESNYYFSHFIHKLSKYPPSAGFSSPSGGVAPSAPHSFISFRRVMRIPNMNVLSFEIGQRESGFYSERTDRITQSSSSVL